MTLDEFKEKFGHLNDDDLRDKMRHMNAEKRALAKILLESRERTMAVDPEFIKLPKNFTIKNLWEEIPATLLYKFCGILFAAFTTGLGFGYGFHDPIQHLFSDDSTTQKLSETGPETPSTINDDITSQQTISAVTSTFVKDYKLIDPLQNELTIERIESGQFGYTSATDINAFVDRGVYPRVFYEDVFLRIPIGVGSDKHIWMQVYVSPQDAQSIRDPSRQRNSYTGFNKSRPDLQAILINLEKVTVFNARFLPSDQGLILDFSLR